MARIEMRDCYFRAVDGHSNTAAVDKTTPVSGDSNIDIDTLGTSGIIPVSCRFTVVGSDQTYRVTAQDGGTVATVTFTGAVSGNITLKVGSNPTTANILYSANAAAVKAAIVTAGGVLASEVTVLQSSGLWTITLSGRYGKTQTDIVATGVSLMDVTPTAVVPVVAYTSTGGITRNITFTPPFNTANGIPADDAVITFTGRTVEAKIGDGNFQYTENTENEYLDDRGMLDTVREGKQVPMDVNMDFVWDFITGYTDSGNPTFEDAIKNRGEAADWISSSNDPCEKYAVDLEVDHIPPCANEQGERFIFPDFRKDKLTHDMGKSQVNATGRCNAVEPIIERYTQPAKAV
jgi:hypothetical protein